MKTRRLRIFLALLLLAPAFCHAQEASLKADILVYDSTPGGIVAAIAAAKEGSSVILITEDKHLGAMRTSGLAMSNAGDEKTFAGLGREFHDRIHRHYIGKYGEQSEQVKLCRKGLRFEPHVAEKIFDDWLAETQVKVLKEEPVASLEKEGARILSVTTENKRRISASVFIDASYEGDLIKWAGCSNRVGREGSAEYDEPLAGVRYPPEKVGQADGKTQRYTYRVCLTDVAENRVPITRPANYHRASYAADVARIERKPPASLGALLPLNMLPNRKTDSRTGEWIGGSWAFPEASREERAVIAREHREYSEGYLWFLLTDASVPKAIRKEMSRWGYAKDEFTDNGNFPHHIYVREARRLVGDFVMTQKDAQDEASRFKPDSVALGSYRLDVHDVQYVAGKDGGIVPEGSMKGGIFVKPYEIPYRVLLPKKAEAANLLVPVCVSASHIALSTLRMEPVYMMLGHASGVAASMSIKSGKPLHDLPVQDLQEKLLAQKQIISAKGFDEPAKNIDP
ncbi:MAG: FAD-dependent oxidoreductase [Akkermansiaceae bacterium]|nr:FAD-dependent oxidoreductase [Akkermansiaceae bacterium]